MSVEFPDLSGAYTCSDDDAEALRMAKDCLALNITGMKEDGDTIPRPSDVKNVVVGENQSVVMVEL
ncbi:type II toxin-antitoxin system HicB family antitoxin [Paenibacillus algicola]|nr:type II toxin-antitoxin system HicB family antitoxin [Paenibacillus algicola]